MQAKVIAKDGTYTFREVNKDWFRSTFNKPFEVEGKTYVFTGMTKLGAKQMVQVFQQQ